MMFLRTMILLSTFNKSDKDDDDDDGNGIVPQRILNLDAHVNCSATLI